MLDRHFALTLKLSSSSLLWLGIKASRSTVATDAASSAPHSRPHHPKSIFKSYKTDDATKYAAYRTTYTKTLIDLVIKSHTSTGRSLASVLDVRCVPWTATMQVASFRHVSAVDASPSVIEIARKTPCTIATGDRATFEVCQSENLDQ